MTNNGLILLIKNPRKGNVKTRLAKTIGDEAALRVYNNLLDYTEKVVTSVNAEKHIYFTHKPIDSDPMSTMSNIRMQTEGDLGERLDAAITEVIKQQSKVIVIGSDCPEITSDIIDDAFSKLDISDVVLGPTHDGGYYLIGMNGYYPDIIKDISWSTAEVLTQTISKVQKNNLLYTLLETKSDLDNEDDLNNFPRFKD